MEFQIPVFDTEVDTSDPGESASNLAGALGGGVLLLGLVTGAQYVFNRISDVAGSDESADIPGV
jgi:hypothetical protein